LLGLAQPVARNGVTVAERKTSALLAQVGLAPFGASRRLGGRGDLRAALGAEGPRWCADPIACRGDRIDRHVGDLVNRLQLGDEAGQLGGAADDEEDDVGVREPDLDLRHGRRLRDQAAVLLGLDRHLDEPDRTPLRGRVDGDADDRARAVAVAGVAEDAGDERIGGRRPRVAGGGRVRVHLEPVIRAPRLARPAGVHEGGAFPGRRPARGPDRLGVVSYVGFGPGSATSPTPLGRPEQGPQLCREDRRGIGQGLTGSHLVDERAEHVDRRQQRVGERRHVTDRTRPDRTEDVLHRMRQVGHPGMSDRGR
jgi:hypothetical protein